MFFWWGSGWGWLAGLITAGLWILIIVGAIVLLRRELPDLQHRFSRPPALRVLEERYAKGEITREDFLHRREVLMSAHDPTSPPPAYQAPPQPPSSAPPPSFEPPSADPPQAPSADLEPAAESPPATDHEGGAMSSTWEPPSQAPSGSPRSGAEPTQPLPSAEPPQ